MSLSYFPRTVKGERQAQKRDGVYNSDHIGTCLTTGEKTQATGHIAGSQRHKCPFSQYVEILIIFPKAFSLPMSSPYYQMPNFVQLCCVSFKSFLFCSKILRIKCGGWYTCHSIEVQTTCGSLLSASTMRVSKTEIRSLGLVSVLFTQLYHTRFSVFLTSKSFPVSCVQLMLHTFFISYNYINIGSVLFNFTRPQKRTQRQSNVHYDLPSLLDLH